MRITSLITFYAVAASGARALDSLSSGTKDLPKCVYSALADAMKQAGCDIAHVDSSDFDCLCKHSSTIIVIMGKKVDTVCLTDAGQAIGRLCSYWGIDGTTATDLPAATSALAAALGAGGSNSDAKATATDGGTANASPSTSATRNAGAAPTAAVMGLMGGAAAAAAAAGMMV
ncbi:hypothetical protein QQS21_000250 [Conoideocrella luteorostrata]|uniref:Extracellular membrane protein CFEM domain-containing protein n=1 Tax=Conoideocrella luteorostrata TaxID=1105319 RepID=A0AAJ0D1C9_9HYPO|nr:hypothetical protein QQS21_000250 [Conoideocrella luteorostrata]